MNSKEIWLPVKDYEGLYEVSNHGNVRSLGRYVRQSHSGAKPTLHFYKGKFLSNTCKHGHYPKVKLSKNRKYKTTLTHRIVAETFLKKEKHKNEVNHIDGDKKNNHVNNLEWCTSSQNKIHAFKSGINKSPIGKESHGFKGSIEVTDKSGKIIKILHGTKEINDFGMTSSGISNVLSGYIKTHRGYFVRRIE